MSEENQCKQCRAELAADAPYGLCPGCLLKRGLETQSVASGGGSHSGRADCQPPSPEELAPYFPELEILELIGRGGMGVVYKARQKRLDRLVALKILSPKFGQDPAFADRFKREARAMGMLSHPHIVAVHDFGQTSPRPSPSGRGTGGEWPLGQTVDGEGSLFYFVMEYVDGANLRRLLETGKLSPQAALAIVPQICDALHYAHKAGVVHRDIKPENILLDKSGRVKIADFGLAKLTGQTQDVSLTGAGQVMGTPHYMAPEQLEHPQAVDHRADIYSLGVVFYQMLTGELPIGRFAPPSRKVQVDVRLDEVVLRALAKEPELRYQQVSEVKTDVETIATTPRAAAVSSGSPPSPGQWGDMVAGFLGITFTSPLARKIANASALGFLGALAFLGYLPFPGMQVCFAFAGFSGFFGLIGIAYLLEHAARRKTLANLAGEESSAPPADSRSLAQARDQIRGPAVGLIITSLVNWLAIFVVALVMLPFASRKGVPPDVFLLAAGILAVGSAVILVGALKMQHVESLGMARLSSVAAMLIGPGYLVGWPVGLWSLVVLSRPEVVAAFHERERSSPSRGRRSWVKSKTLWSILIALAVAFPVRTFVIAPYRAASDAVSPEIRRGSYVMVFKLARAYLPGDIVLYRADGRAELGRVTEQGPRDGELLVQRHHEPPQPVAAEDLIGKVVLNTRVGQTQDDAPNLTVIGTVTDASTGKPIAGARVADNYYGADADKAPQEAWTSAEGRFELKTWYEEHTLAASAPGYETKLVTLLTKTFGSEQEVRTDISLIGQAEVNKAKSARDIAKAEYAQEATRGAGAAEDRAVKEVAGRLLAAMRSSDDKAMAVSACDLIPDWRNALPVLAKEIRGALDRFVQTSEPLSHIDEVLVEGDFAAVKAASVKKVGGSLVLFFSKTPDGWRNCSLKNAPIDASLKKELEGLVRSLDDPLKKRVSAFVELLAQGKVAEVAAQLDATTRKAMPEAKLTEFWRELERKHGNFFGQDPPRVETAAEYFNVFVPCRFERDREEVKVVVNLAGQISGLWAVTPGQSKNEKVTRRVLKVEFSKLEFRVVPNAAGSSRQPLYPLFVGQTTEKFADAATKELAEKGPKEARLGGDEFQWMELGKDVNLPGDLVGQYQGKKYVLISAREPYVLRPKAEGKDAWALEKVSVVKDVPPGAPAVQLRFDQRGGELFAALTKANLYNRLAIVLDGKVVSAPIIQSVMSREVAITGRFSEQEILDLVKALEAGKRPPP